MTQSALFVLLLVTLTMGIAGARELHGRNYGLGALLIGVPIAGWVSIAFGR